MRRETRQERSQWTALVEGVQPAKENKYHAERAGQFASKYESEIAGRLAALERGGIISNLRYQVSYTLVEGVGRIRPIRYVADFAWKSVPDGREHVGDAKGALTAVYRIKKKLMLLLLGIEVEEL